jgi:outer membrane protein W
MKRRSMKSFACVSARLNHAVAAVRWAIVCGVMLASNAQAQQRTEQEFWNSWNGFSFRLGALFLQPLVNSKEVELSHVGGVARLVIENGPLPGSSVGLGNAFLPAGTVGYALPVLNRQFALEAVLALPFRLKLKSQGSLATASLAPLAAQNIPTGLPALGEELGETTVLPPVVTALYRFFPNWWVHPYVGVGVCVLFALDAKITNPILSEVATPRVSIPPQVGWVVQGGAEVRVYERFYLTADVKFIGGLALKAQVDGLYVKLPNLPLYEAVNVGSAKASLDANPLAFQLGLGMNL